MECNHELNIAISRALVVLSYFELPEEEQPDESIWNHPEKLEAWFDEVKKRREDRFGGSKKANDGWEDVDLEQNELTKGYR